MRERGDCPVAECMRCKRLALCWQVVMLYETLTGGVEVDRLRNIRVEWKRGSSPGFWRVGVMVSPKMLTGRGKTALVRMAA